MSQIMGLGQLIGGGMNGQPSPASLMSPPMDPRILQLLQQMQGGPQGLPPGASQLPSGPSAPPPSMGIGGGGPAPQGMGAPPMGGGAPPGLLQLIQQMPPEQLRAILQRLGIDGAGQGAGTGAMPAAPMGSRY